MALQGYLWKTPLSAGLSKSFQKRYFVLSGNRLQYFSDEKAANAKNATPKGELNLEPTGTVLEVPNSPKPFTFCIRSSKEGGDAFLAANSQEQLKAWVLAIQQAMKKRTLVNKAGTLLFKKNTYWWVLNDFYLLQYAKEGDLSPSAELAVKGATLAKDSADPDGLTFTLTPKDKAGTYFFRAPNAGELQAWLDALNRVAVEKQPHKTGFLTFKKNNYWWVLNDFFIQQFAKQGDTACSAELLVTGATVAKDATDSEGLTFTLTPQEGGAAYVFKAPNAAELQSWLDAFARVIAGRKTSDPEAPNKSTSPPPGSPSAPKVNVPKPAPCVWSAVFDETHKRNYFVNTETKTSTWEKPAELEKYEQDMLAYEEAVKAATAAAAAAAAAAALAAAAPPPKPVPETPPKLPPPTSPVKKISDAGLSPPSAPLKRTLTKPAACPWTAVFDETHKRNYFVNTETKASTWEKPAELTQYEQDLQKYEESLKAPPEEPKKPASPISAPSTPTPPPAAAPAAPAAPPAPPVQVLPKPAECVWRSVWEENHKLFYYVNVETKASVWEKPPELAQYEDDMKKYEDSVKAAEAKAAEGAPRRVSVKTNRRISVITFDDSDMSALKTMKVTDVKSLAPTPPTHDKDTLNANALATFAMSSGLYETDRKALVGKKALTEVELTCWAKTLIQPLTKAMNITQEQIKLGAQIFKNILSFMGDRKSRKTQVKHPPKLISMAMDAAEDNYRIEVYCQLMRQTNKNPDKTSLANGFMLMEMCLGCFPPPDKIKMVVSCYLQSSMGPGHSQESGTRLLGCRDNLEKVLFNGARRFAPTEEEVNSAITKTRIAITLFLLDGSQHFFEVKSQTTVADVTMHIMTQFGLDLPTHETSPCFGLSQQTWEDKKFVNEMALFPQTKLLDVVRSWEILEQEYVGEVEFKLVFCPRLYFYTLLKNGVLSKSGLRHYYLQAVQDIVRGAYPVPADEAMNLAALQLQIEFPKENPSGALLDKINNYVPASAQEGQRDLSVRILSLRSALGTKTPAECMRQYLDSVQKLPHFGAIFFKGFLTADAKVHDWDFEAGELSSKKEAVNKIPTELDFMIGISERGVLFQETATKSLKKHVQFKTVTSYGQSTKPEPMFWLITGDPRQPPTSDQCARVIVFKCAQGKNMCDLMKVYQSLPHNKCTY